MSGKEWFSSEIQAMMFSMGDSKRPNMESVRLVEQLILKQLISLIMTAQDLAEECCGRSESGERTEFSCEELIFLVRKDEMLIKRLINYLKAKDQNSKFVKEVESSVSGEVGDEADFLGDEKAGKGGERMCDSKRMKVLRKALERFDVTGEYVAMLDQDVDDPLKQIRMEKIVQRTATMNASDYLRFSEARQTSFCPRTSHRKFREWLFGNQSAMEILNFLAYETLATIMDLAVIVKEEYNKKTPSSSRVRVVEGPGQRQHNSPQVAMALAHKIRDNQPGPKYLKIGIDALQATTILPEDIREAIRRVKCHRKNSLFHSLSCGDVLG